MTDLSRPFEGEVEKVVSTVKLWKWWNLEARRT
jgi:hypothetical protein